MPNLKLKRKKFVLVAGPGNEREVVPKVEKDVSVKQVFSSPDEKMVDPLVKTIDLLHEYLEAEVTELFLMEKSGERLSRYYSAPFSLSTREFFEVGNATFVGECAKKNIVLEIENPLDDLRSKRENLGKNISMMGMMRLDPLIENKNCIGILRIMLKNGSSLSNEKIKFISYMQKQICCLITNDSCKEQLENVCSSMIDILIKKDNYTGGHTKRVGAFAEMIAGELGMNEREIYETKISAILHDIGKIGIPDNILKKNAPLTNDEFEIMKKHPQFGYEILKHMKSFDDIAKGVRYHHERPDGSGYPCGLKGDEIPLIAQIVAVADAYDALISNRPYRKGVDAVTALEEIMKYEGTQFSTKVVRSFEKIIKNSNTFNRIKKVS